MKKLLKKNASYTVSIIQNPFKLIKNKMLYFTLLIGVFAFVSCFVSMNLANASFNSALALSEEAHFSALAIA